MATLSIVIPAFDEEPRLGSTLSSILQAMNGGLLPGIAVTEVIVSDDGSVDGTSSVAESFKNRLPIEVVRLSRNRGKGAATREGMRKVTGDYALIYDADGATPITELPRFFDALREHDADIAIGSRVHATSERPVEMSLLRRIIGRTYHALCAGLHPGIADAACGCKLFTVASARKIFEAQRIDRFAYDIEILALARRFGFRIVEVPVTWRAVPKSKVRLLRDGTQMFASVVWMYMRKIRGKL